MKRLLCIMLFLLLTAGAAFAGGDQNQGTTGTGTTSTGSSSQGHSTSTTFGPLMQFELFLMAEFYRGRKGSAPAVH